MPASEPFDQHDEQVPREDDKKSGAKMHNSFTKQHYSITYLNKFGL